MKEPMIRFQGFEGEWEDTPFTSIARRISTSETSGILPGVEFEDIIAGEGLLNKDVHSKDCKKAGKLFSCGDILFGKLRPYLRNILLAGFDGVAIGDFWVLHPENIESKLLYELVNSKEFMSIANVSSGSKMPRADWTYVSNSSFIVPTNKVEQQAIASFFTHLDTLISSSTSRLASLKQIKAASLQAMFPQKGETVPKLRFKGFEGDWEKAAYSDIFEKVNDRNHNVDRSKYQQHGIVPIVDQSKTYIVGYTDIKKPIKVNEDGYIIFGDHTREWKYVDFDFCTGADGTQVLKVSKNFDCKFIYYECISLDIPNTGYNRHLKYVKISTFLIPSLPEQQAIASYFTAIDRKITLQSQRLEKLKQIKAACLDKMFV